MTTRNATPNDAASMARIYNEGIEDRLATFETRPRSAADIRQWFDGIHPIVVVVEDNGEVVAFACYVAVPAAGMLCRDRRNLGVRGARLSQEGRRQPGAQSVDPSGAAGRILETAFPRVSGERCQPRLDPRAWLPRGRNL